jgi:hypothetical protein
MGKSANRNILCLHNLCRLCRIDFEPRLALPRSAPRPPPGGRGLFNVATGILRSRDGALISSRRRSILAAHQSLTCGLQLRLHPLQRYVHHVGAREFTANNVVYEPHKSRARPPYVLGTPAIWDPDLADWQEGIGPGPHSVAQLFGGNDLVEEARRIRDAGPSIMKTGERVIAEMKALID